MKKTSLLIAAIILSACTPDTSSTQVDSASEATYTNSSQAVLDKYKQHYQVSANSNGVIIFDKPEQLFEALNDYPSDSNQFEKINDKPLNIRLSSRTTQASNPEVLKGETEITLLYGILKVFANTNAESLNIKSVPIDENDKFFNQYALSLNVTREQVLKTLRELNLANSFDDLVETKQNDQFRFIGLSGSKKYDDIVYKDNNRKELIKSLK